MYGETLSVFLAGIWNSFSDGQLLDMFPTTSRFCFPLWPGHSQCTSKEICNSLMQLLARSPIAQMADIGFKVVLLERLNQKWKQNHLQNPCNESKNQGGDHV